MSGAVRLTVVLVAALTGCHNLPIADEGAAEKPAAAPVPAAGRVAAGWKGEVKVAADPVRGGSPTIGLTGRVYLFSSDLAQPIDAGGGKMVVTLYDHTPQDNGGDPKKLEIWRFDSKALALMRANDMFGIGYQLFLAWGTYRPDIKRVFITAEYQPPGGGPAWTAPGSVVTLKHDEVTERGR